jgi:hypothetical protein
MRRRRLLYNLNSNDYLHSVLFIYNIATRFDIGVSSKFDGLNAEAF